MSFQFAKLTFAVIVNQFGGEYRSPSDYERWMGLRLVAENEILLLLFYIMNLRILYLIPVIIVFN